MTIIVDHVAKQILACDQPKSKDKPLIAKLVALQPIIYYSSGGKVRVLPRIYTQYHLDHESHHLRQYYVPITSKPNSTSPSPLLKTPNLPQRDAKLDELTCTTVSSATVSLLCFEFR